jgi:hypothetical protein
MKNSNRTRDIPAYSAVSLAHGLPDDYILCSEKKSGVIPVRAWTVPEGSWRLKFLDFKTVDT